MEPFSIKSYVGEESPTLKGNGFDGLRIGETREEAEEFIRYVNQLIAEVERRTWVAKTRP